MRLYYLLPLAVVSAACPPSSTCSPSSCRGCCTSDGVCHTGSENSACGADGLGCNDCTSANATCTASHVCLTGSTAGGSGGGNGTGGGTTTTVFPPGTNEQQLISGTRLKAVRVIGADGAQAPFASVFWDTQLQIPCAPGQNAYAFASYYQLFIQQDLASARCYPSMVAYDLSFGLLPQTFGNPTCSELLYAGMQSYYRQYFGAPTGGGAPSPMGIFSPASLKYGLRTADGGFGLYSGTYARATRHMGPLYVRIGDGGCALQTDGGTGYDYYSLGADVPDTEFAEMTVAVDP
ncbi:MAG: hypothetical protein JNK82_07890 [Myxococcaceae bacterium]|nr:hypothetical protein [Myxococcaceae bacterium]